MAAEGDKRRQTSPLALWWMVWVTACEWRLVHRLQVTWLKNRITTKTWSFKADLYPNICKWAIGRCQLIRLPACDCRTWRNWRQWLERAGRSSTRRPGRKGHPPTCPCTCQTPNTCKLDANDRDDIMDSFTSHISRHTYFSNCTALSRLME